MTAYTRDTIEARIREDIRPGQPNSITPLEVANVLRDMMDTASFEDGDIEALGVPVDGSDASAALSAALVTAAGRPLRIKAGKTVRLASALTSAQSVHLCGGGTVQIDFAGTAITVTAGDFICHDIAWDGNDTAIQAVQVNDAGLVSIERCSFTDFDSDTFAIPVTIIDAERLSIRDTTFRSIKALADGTVGNTNGAVRAIYITGEVLNGLVENCIFDDINNRTAEGVFADEDADAINTAPSSGKVQNITFRGNKFVNCGKRCYKLVGLSGSIYRIVDDTASSAYTGTTDTIGATGNGMYAFAEVFGGRATISGVRFVGGVCGYFVAASTTAIAEINIDENTYIPEYHKYVRGSLTRFAIMTALASTAVVNVRRNNVDNVWTAYEYTGTDNGGRRTSLIDNELTTYSSAVMGLGEYPTVRGGRIAIDSSSAETTANAISIGAGVDRFIVEGVHVEGYQDALNIAAQSAACWGSVTGCTFVGQTRAAGPIANNAGTSYQKYITFSNNNLGSTSPPSVSGSSGTLDVGTPPVDFYVVTGNVAITTIVASWPGRRLTVRFSSATPGGMTDGSNLKLAGNFVATQNDTITLVCDGTDWYEVCRSGDL